MRRACRFVLLLALLASTAAAMEGTYYLVLKDGTWAPVAARPTVEGEMVRIPLHSGLQAILPADHVDFEASDRYTSEGTQPPGPHAVPGKGLAADATFVNAVASGVPDAPPPSAGAARVVPLSAMSVSSGSASDDRVASLHEQIATIDQAIQEQEARKSDLLEDAHSSYDLDQAEELRKQAAGIDDEISRLRNEKENLLIDLWSLQQP